MKLEDHYAVNVARRVKPDTERWGPYHTHHMRVELPNMTKVEALERFDEISTLYPEPEYRVSMHNIVIRSILMRESGEKGVSPKEPSTL